MIYKKIKLLIVFCIAYSFNFICALNVYNKSDYLALILIYCPKNSSGQQFKFAWLNSATFPATSTAITKLGQVSAGSVSPDVVTSAIPTLINSLTLNSSSTLVVDSNACASPIIYNVDFFDPKTGDHIKYLQVHNTSDSVIFNDKMVAAPVFTIINSTPSPALINGTCFVNNQNSQISINGYSSGTFPYCDDFAIKLNSTINGKTIGTSNLLNPDTSSHAGYVTWKSASSGLENPYLAVVETGNAGFSFEQIKGTPFSKDKVYNFTLPCSQVTVTKDVAAYKNNIYIKNLSNKDYYIYRDNDLWGKVPAGKDFFINHINSIFFFYNLEGAYANSCILSARKLKIDSTPNLSPGTAGDTFNGTIFLGGKFSDQGPLNYMVVISPDSTGKITAQGIAAAEEWHTGFPCYYSFASPNVFQNLNYGSNQQISCQECLFSTDSNKPCNPSTLELINSFNNYSKNSNSSMLKYSTFG